MSIRATQRILVPDVSTPFVGRLFSIDIATGNRTVLTASTSEVELHFPDSVAFDPATEQVYIGMAERARVYPIRRRQHGSHTVRREQCRHRIRALSVRHPARQLIGHHRAVFGHDVPGTHHLPNGHRGRHALSLANYLGTGGAPTFGSPGNFVHDTRAGMAGKALFLDTPLNNPVITLNSVDLVSGALTLVASAPFPITGSCRAWRSTGQQPRHSRPHDSGRRRGQRGGDGQCRAR